MAKEIKEYGIPFEEIIEVRYNDENENLIYIVTRHPYRHEHYLYKIIGDKSKKVATEDNPNNFKVLKKLHEDWVKKCEEEEKKLNEENKKE